MATECEHKFVHLQTARWVDDNTAYNIHFFRVDTFFCEKCLEQRKVEKDEYSRETPHWYRVDK